MREGSVENRSDNSSLPMRLTAPTEIFGRVEELKTIQEAVESFDNNSVCLEIFGEPGTGKSYFQKNMLDNIPDTQAFRLAFKRESRSKPYALLNDLFNELLVLLTKTKEEEELTSWYQKVSPLIEGLPAELVQSLGFTAATNLKGSQGNNQVAPTTNKKLLENFYIDFAKELIQEIRGKLVLQIDNLSLYEKGTLETIFKVFVGIDSPIMIVLSGRPGEWQELRQQLLEALDEDHHKRFTVELRNFTLNETNSFIEFCLENKVEGQNELAELFFETTSGNPKNLIESIRKLVKDDNLFYNEKAAVWNCKVDPGLFRSKMSIVSLFLNKYERLDQNVQKVLDFSACLGSSINAPVLSKLLRLNSNVVNEALLVCAEEGFLDQDIVATQQGNRSGGSYHFSSEDVAHAIQGQIAVDQQQKFHRIIADHLINRSATGVSEHDVFDAATHLNKSLDLPMSNDERTAYTKLNILAAKKSRLLTSFETGNDFIKNGIRIANVLSWELNAKLLQELYVEAYHLSKLNGDANAASEYLNLGLNKFDTDAVFEILFVKMVLEIQFGLLKEGLSTGLGILSKLGVKIKSNTGRITVLIEFFKTRRLLKRKSIDEIYNLSEVNNIRLERTFQVMFWLYRASQYIAPELNGVLALRQLQLMLKYGTNGEAWSGLMAYGVIIGAGMNDYETAFNYSELGGRIAEKYGNNSGKVIFGKAIYWPFKHSLVETLEFYEESKEKLFREGDYIGAAEATVNESLTLLSLGYRLEDVVNKIHENLEFCEKVSTVDFQEFQKMLLLNIDQIREGCENEVCANLKSIVENTEYSITRAVNLIVNIKLAYLKEDFNEARTLIERAPKEVENLTGLYFKTEYDFYTALTYLKLIGAGKATVGVKRKVAKIIKRYNKWSLHSPMNYAHKRDLLLGVDYLNKGQFDKARQRLIAARDLSEELNNIHIKAIALAELSSCNHDSQDRKNTDLIASKEAFNDWGISWK